MQHIRRYKYSYQTIVRYSTDVTNHHFLLRCTPIEGENQRIIEQEINLLSPTYMNRSMDVFGNIIHYGSMINRHDLFVVASSGVVECDNYGFRDDAPKQIFLSPTPLTSCDSRMSEFCDGACSAPSAVDQAMVLAGQIFHYMDYAPNITTIHTKANESFRLRKGVCQDFAHILIAMCRRRSIYARYVAGFVVGTGQTHAWVEVYDGGVWYGVDPTYNLFITSNYVKIAHGRDATDCSVTRGLYTGIASESTEVRVVLESLF